MYQFSYAETLKDAGETARRTEAMALDHSVDLMHKADSAGPGSRDVTEALHFTTRLWTRFIEDLGQPGNDLPRDLRASLISIGFWMIKEAERIRLGERTAFRGMIDISTIVREGLK